MEHEKVLFLGPGDSPLIDWLREQGHEVAQTADRLSASGIAQRRHTFLVSYGYRHILRKDVLDLFPGRAINLHIAFLPWNRGADPNLWSFVEDTPKGVTIHHIDEGVDTGDIIVQRRMEFDAGGETLATSYRKLHELLQALFREHWDDIRHGRCQSVRQTGGGSVHRVSDRERLSHLLTDGWDTPVSVLDGHAAGR